jgi:hypothetical protein
MSALDELIRIECNKFHDEPSQLGEMAKEELSALRTRIAELEKLVDDAVKWHEGEDSPHAQLEQRIAELEAAELFHPRAMKLIRKRKYFVVIAEDEPYFVDVYAMICDHERSKGTWTEIDEQNYQDALTRRMPLPKPPEAE